MKAIHSLLVFQCLIFMNCICMFAQDINNCVGKVFSEQTRISLGKVNEYRENIFRYDKASTAIDVYNNQIDSLKNIIWANSHFSDSEQNVLAEMIDLAGNNISGDSYSHAKDCGSNLILKLNKYIPIQYIYELERGFIKETLIKDEVVSWAQSLCEFVMNETASIAGTHFIDVPSSTLEFEIEFYNCNDGEVIANIGSKLGDFERSLSNYDDNLAVYTSEMHAHWLKYLKTKLGLLQLMDKKEITFTCVLGDEQSSNLPNKSFDKVMMRNVFHHLAEKEAMLNNVRTILKKNGRLFITEFLQDGLDPSPHCQASLSRNDLLQIVNSNSFVLVKESKLPNSKLVIFEFKIR